MIGEEFLQRIDDPSNKKLRDELLKIAIKNCKKKLREEGISSDNIKKFASTFYYDWEKDGKPDYVFLIQNPGLLQRDRHFGDEIYALKECSSPIERVRIYRKYFKTWLLQEKNKSFSKQFLKKLKDHELIEFGQWDKYIKNGDFFKDFYATDVVKYRTDTSEIDEKKGENAEVSFDEFLKEELSYIEPKLIFVFGRRAWNILRRKMDTVVEDEGKTIEGSQDAITDVHGYLFKSKKILETYILPLAHFSGRNNFLRGSYFQYLDKGLSNYYE